MQHGIFIVGFGEPRKSFPHLRIRLRATWHVVQAHALHHAAPVVRTDTNGDHLQPGIEQLNCGQDARAMQAIRVQIVRAEVGRRDKAHALGKQGAEQPVQDHGVRDVGHVELVKTNQPVLFGHL